jgi:hypothetical protein
MVVLEKCMDWRQFIDLITFWILTPKEMHIAEHHAGIADSRLVPDSKDLRR